MNRVELSEPESHDVASSSDESETEDESFNHRGRSFSQVTARPKRLSPNPTLKPSKRPSPHPSMSSLRSDSPAKGHRRTSFTRSRSPAYATLVNGTSPEIRPQTKVSSNRSRNKPFTTDTCLLPARWRFTTPLPGIGTWNISVDARVAAESVLLLISLAGVTHRLSEFAQDLRDTWVQRGNCSCLCHRVTPLTLCTVELVVLMVLSVSYSIWVHSTLIRHRLSTAPVPPPSPGAQGSRPSRLVEMRDAKRGMSALGDNVRDEFGYIWMTVPKNYRYPPKAPLRRYR